MLAIAVGAPNEKGAEKLAENDAGCGAASENGCELSSGKDKEEARTGADATAEMGAAEEEGGRTENEGRDAVLV